MTYISKTANGSVAILRKKKNKNICVFEYEVKKKETRTGTRQFAFRSDDTFLSKVAF